MKKNIFLKIFGVFMITLIVVLINNQYTFGMTYAVSENKNYDDNTKQFLLDFENFHTENPFIIYAGHRRSDRYYRYGSGRHFRRHSFRYGTRSRSGSHYFRYDSGYRGYYGKPRYYYTPSRYPGYDGGSRYYRYYRYNRNCY